MYRRVRDLDSPASWAVAFWLLVLVLLAVGVLGFWAAWRLSLRTPPDPMADQGVWYGCVGLGGAAVLVVGRWLLRRWLDV